MTMKSIPAEHVLAVKEKDKRNTKKRFLITDGICLKCGAIVNYNYEKRCILCCGSNEFLVGEQSKVLRELLELHIDELKYICKIKKLATGSRIKMVSEIFKKIFPKLVNIDERIDYNLIRKIIIRNRKRFWFVTDIENAIFKVKRDTNIYSQYKVKYIKQVRSEDVVEINGVKIR